MGSSPIEHSIKGKHVYDRKSKLTDNNFNSNNFINNNNSIPGFTQGLHQKRHNSSANNHTRDTIVKRRLPVQSDENPIGNFLDSFSKNSSPLQQCRTPGSRPHSVTKKPVI